MNTFIGPISFINTQIIPNTGEENTASPVLIFTTFTGCHYSTITTTKSDFRTHQTLSLGFNETYPIPIFAYREKA